MDHVAPGAWTDVLTKRDLDAFEQRMNGRFEALGQRFDALGHRFREFTGESLGVATRAQSELIRAQTRTLVAANVVTLLLAAPVLFAVGKLA